MPRRAIAVSVSSLLAAGLLAGGLQPPLAGAVGPPNTTLDSRATGAGGAKGNGNSFVPRISGDGRMVVFESLATNLDVADNTNDNDIYVRDRRTGTTALVSRATGAAGVKANFGGSSPFISADGRRVAFQSSASNLDPGDPDTAIDVFVRDLVAGTTTLVSRATGAAGVKATGISAVAGISADGNRVAFTSSATNLDPDDVGNSVDVYVRDLAANTTTLVSRATGATGVKANFFSVGAAISDDGRHVSFTTPSSNLDAADANAFNDVYVRDLVGNTTTLVSRATGAAGAAANANVNGAAELSADGRLVVFEAAATNLDPADADGTLDVFVRDLASNTTALVSRATGATGAKGNAFSERPDISADGRVVSFASTATNLDAADADVTRDVYVRDLLSATTTLASRAAAGAKGNASSGNGRPSLSGDGRYVAFDSSATNLDPADTDVMNDVYTRIMAMPEVTGAQPPSIRRGFTRTVSIIGSGFTATPEVIFGAGVTVSSVKFVSSTRLDVVITVAPDAVLGQRSIVVINPAGDSIAVSAGLAVVAEAGYWLVAKDGGIFSFNAVFSGSTGALKLNQPIVGMAADPDGKGYWFVAADGGVFAFDATFHGSMGGKPLNQPIVGMAAAPDGKGYWLVARDGGIFSFGSAAFAGSTGAIKLNQPIVGMAADPDGKGYWFVAADGGIFAFDATFSGSMGAQKLNRPIVGMAADSDGKGYWLVASDGGIFSFDAVFSGSTGALKLNQPIVGMAADPDGKGYWFVAADGGIFAFDAVFHGSMGAQKLNQPIVGMAPA